MHPQPDRCGSVTRCITACPTGAITDSHRLDARRCISYLTIELKGSIPLELRPLIGDRIYGCDDCLDACPWNRFAAASRECRILRRATRRQAFRLRDYLPWMSPNFALLFPGSPIKRIKRRGFLRNVCVALGNVGDPADLPALERGGRDPEPLDRRACDMGDRADPRASRRRKCRRTSNLLNPEYRVPHLIIEDCERVCLASV